MRTSTFLLALPALATAQDQAPLFDKIKGLWQKGVDTASSYIPTNIPSVVPPNPVDAGAAKVAARVVHSLSLDNWRSVLRPSASATTAGPEEWMVFFDGANKTCYGLCEKAGAAWNKSSAVLATLPSGPSLARVDCDAEQILCNAWAVGPPSIYHLLLPAPMPDQSRPATTARYIQLNRTTIDAADITEIHTQQKYLDTAPYEGYFHPFDGILAQTGVAVPLAYAMWGLNLLPSWAPMIIISLFSRIFIGNRAAGQARRGPPAAAPAGGAPAAGRR